MGMVLAHAFAALEGHRGAVLHVADAGLVAHRAAHGLGEGLRAFARIGRAVQGLVGEGLELIVGGGERGGRQVGQRRERAVLLTGFDVGGLDHAVNDDGDLAVRLLDGEEVGDIAVGIDLLEAAAGGVDLPGQRALREVAARRQVQALHAVFDRAFVAVRGFVPNVQLHGIVRPPPVEPGNQMRRGRPGR